MLREARDKERMATVETSKVKEERPVVAGGRCWKKFWLMALQITGELFIHLLSTEGSKC